MFRRDGVFDVESPDSMIFRWLRGRGAGTDAGDRNPSLARENGSQGIHELFADIDALTSENRAHPDPEVERRILRLRHLAALQLMEEPAGHPEHPRPAFELLPGVSDLPEVAPGQLTPELLRAAILRHGCLLVRELVAPDAVARLVEGIDRAFEARDASASAGAADGPYHEEFVPDPRFDLSADRRWIGGSDNFWGPDSPRVMVGLFDMFERTGLRSLATDYLGERPAISVNKCTLRRVSPESFKGQGFSYWHQDGAFLGEVRALNVWLSLTHCGDVAPGLDIVPRRLDHVVPTGTEGATFDWSVAQSMAEEVAGDVPIHRPIFEPGDVLLFDELFLHATAAEPEMSKTRYAVECWFFGPSAFPGDYPPLAC